MKITIIGAGEIGRAIEKIISGKGDPEIEIFLWDKDQTKTKIAQSLQEIIPQSDFVFLCVPSFTYSEVIAAASPYLQKEAVVISLAKGMLPSGKTVAETVTEGLPENQSGFLAGPMIAEEILAGAPAAAIFASKEESVFRKTADLFGKTNLKIIWSSDTDGVSLVSVLKNVYALLFGVCDGLGMSVNAKGVLFKKCVSEMENVLEVSGGKRETALSLAGIGDFFATATSLDSKNHSVGFKIGREKVVEFSGEGAISFEGLKVKLNEKLSGFTVLSAVETILKNPEKSEDVIKNLLWS